MVYSSPIAIVSFVIFFREMLQDQVNILVLVRLFPPQFGICC